MSAENSRASAAVLTPFRFRPGQSGNPGGRPKKLPITDYLKTQLEEPIPEAMRAKLPEAFTTLYGPEATFGQMLAFRLIMLAAKGDSLAMREVLDRTEGKVTQKVAGENGGPVVFTIERLGCKECRESGH